jgi:acylphosphatase
MCAPIEGNAQRAGHKLDSGKESYSVRLSGFVQNLRTLSVQIYTKCM